MENFTFFQVSGSNSRKSRFPSLVGKLSKVQSQATLWIIQSMTGKAVLGKNRADLPIEVNFLSPSLPWERQCKEEIYCAGGKLWQNFVLTKIIQGLSLFKPKEYLKTAFLKEDGRREVPAVQAHCRADRRPGRPGGGSHRP